MFLRICIYVVCVPCSVSCVVGMGVDGVCQRFRSDGGAEKKKKGGGGGEYSGDQITDERDGGVKVESQQTGGGNTQ